VTFSAISVIQPWPWLILRPDLADPEAVARARAQGQVKDVENRDWETSVRSWVLLHASSTRLAKWTYQEAALFALQRGVDVPLRDNLPYGAVVGAIRIDDCVRRSASRWFVGPMGFVIGEAVPFATPVPCGGSLKFFNLPLEASDPEFAEALAGKLAAEISAAGLAKEFRI
jgi:hypothetical protein